MNSNIMNQSQDAKHLLLKNIPANEFYTSLLTRQRIYTTYSKIQKMAHTLPLNDD